MRYLALFVLVLGLAACGSSEKKSEAPRRKASPVAQSIQKGYANPADKISSSLEPRAQASQPGQTAPLANDPYREEALREQRIGARLNLPSELVLARRDAALPSEVVVACLVVEEGRISDRRSRAIAGALRREKSLAKSFALTDFDADQELAAVLKRAKKRGAGLLALCLRSRERSVLILDAEGKALLARLRAGRRELACEDPVLKALGDRLARLWEAD